MAFGFRVGGDQGPVGLAHDRTGGGPFAKAMIWLRSASIKRGLRPGPGRSPSPSTPSTLKRGCLLRNAALGAFLFVDPSF